MTKQVIFAFTLLITIGAFSYTIRRIISFFKLTRPAFPVKDFGKRIKVMLSVAFAQTKIFRKPWIGLAHAIVFWGFCVILFGSIEMVIDGLTGTDKVLRFLGPFYDFIMASGDFFALHVAMAILIFIFRRLFLHIRRFEGIEMKEISHIDAKIALTIILVLMISLLTMNIGYVGNHKLTGEEMIGYYPISSVLVNMFQGLSAEGFHSMFEISWWIHILLIFVFANILPYSKHFHVFMSVPNVFLSRLEPLGKLPNMDSITL